jgi:hypothetical protein
MPDIPVPEPLGYIGVVLVILGIFLFIAGLGIINVDKVTIRSGKNTWGLGLFITFIGILFLTPYIRAVIPSTPTNINTATPTLTVVPALTPVPCVFHFKPATRNPFPPSNLTGSITSPTNCDMGVISGRQSPIAVQGTAQEIPSSSYLWLFVYAPDGKYYPQCNNIPATKRECTLSDEWSMRTYLGYECKPFYLVLVSMNSDATNFLLSTLNAWQSSGSYTGLTRNELKPYEIKELQSIQVETGVCTSQTPTP